MLFFIDLNLYNLYSLIDSDLYTEYFYILSIMGCPGLEPGTSRME